MTWRVGVVVTASVTGKAAGCHLPPCLVCSRHSSRILCRRRPQCPARPRITLSRLSEEAGSPIATRSPSTARRSAPRRRILLSASGQPIPLIPRPSPPRITSVSASGSASPLSPDPPNYRGLQVPTARPAQTSQTPGAREPVKMASVSRRTTRILTNSITAMTKVISSFLLVQTVAN